MKNSHKNSENAVASISGNIGRGLLAGLVGTAAITLSQTIEMYINGRKASQVPAEAAGKTLGVQPVNEEEKQRFSNIVHWSYGTSWGAARGMLASLGIHGLKASAIQFVAIWGTEMVMLPSMKLSPPVSKWHAKELLVDGLHHAVYAFAAGLMYDSMHRSGRKQNV